MSPSTPAPTGTHLVLLLDRSGSMASIATDVIGGVNTFLAEQRADGADARVSLVQFDSQNPQDTVAWGVPVAEIVDLDSATFVPRGGTPLLDATGLTIGRVMVENQARLATGLPAEDVVFVAITDGEENSSREYTLERVKSLIAERTAEGWTFVYLSAGLDAYGDAAALGITVDKTQRWEASAGGTAKLLSSTSRAVSSLRDKKRRGLDVTDDDFFAGGKDAEDES